MRSRRRRSRRGRGLPSCLPTKPTRVRPATTNRRARSMRRSSTSCTTRNSMKRSLSCSTRRAVLHDSHINSGHSVAEADRVVTQHFAELIRESEAIVDTIAREVISREDMFLDEEIDQFVERYAPSTHLEPAFEDFIHQTWQEAAERRHESRQQGRAGRQSGGARPDVRAGQAAAEPVAQERDAKGDWQTSCCFAADCTHGCSASRVHYRSAKGGGAGLRHIRGERSAAAAPSAIDAAAGVASRWTGWDSARASRGHAFAGACRLSRSARRRTRRVRDAA